MWKTHECCFTKNILTAGEGFSCPVTESKCNVVVQEVSNCDENPLSDDFKNSVLEIGEFTVGWPVNGAMKVLEDLVITMKKGEVSQFHISMSSQLTRDHLSTDVTDDTKNECTVFLELSSFDDAIPLWKLSDPEKYDLALCHKNEGSKLFQHENVLAGFFHYSLAMKYLISMSVNDEQIDSDDEKCRNLVCICHLNLAACQLKYKDYDSVIMNCSKALNIDGSNVKAFFRRACAYKELGRNGDARSDLLWAKKLEPRSKVIRDLLLSLPVVGSGAL